MPRKLTYQEVKEYIESFNYKLLSEEYVDNKTKLKMLCPCGTNGNVILEILKLEEDVELVLMS